jgi:exosortase A
MNTTIPMPTLPSHWRAPLIVLSLLFAAVLVLYAHTARSMASIWSVSDTYAHGMVVPLISAWLIWRIRHALAPLNPRPSISAGVLLMGVAVFWLAGDLVAVNAVTHLAFVLLFVLAVPTVLGWQVALAMAFPLAFLLFAVPIGDFMLPQLMEWTADFTVLALRLSGIPVYREGLQFIIPSGAWSVVEACSGIRYMIASVTVGCLFAYLSYQSLTKRLLFVGFSILVPLVANWMRAYLIVMIGHLSGNELATGVDHLVYGWLFFGLVIVIMLFIGARWADAPTAPARPQSFSPSALTNAHHRSVVVAGLAALAVVASPHLFERLLSLGNVQGPAVLAAPKVQTPWQPTAQTPSQWTPAFKFPSDVSHTGYEGPDEQKVGMHITYYRAQDYERKLVTSVNVLVTSDDKTWSQVSSGSTPTQFAGEPITVSSAVLREQAGGLTASSPRLLVWRFYWVNSRFTASDVVAKLQGALSRVTGQGDDGAIVVVYTPLDQRLAEPEALNAAKRLLGDFLQTQGTAIEAALEQTRGVD